MTTTERNNTRQIIVLNLLPLQGGYFPLHPIKSLHLSSPLPSALWFVRLRLQVIGIMKYLSFARATSSPYFTWENRKTERSAVTPPSSMITHTATHALHFFRRKLQELGESTILIASYDILRNDIEQLKDIIFNYCVLDEGHIIRNSKTKITRAVKMIQANHRLILSGTPIQVLSSPAPLYKLIIFIQ